MDAEATTAPDMPDVTSPWPAAQRLLTDLGSTPEEIAAALTAEGVTGATNNSTDCVLAKYLRAHSVPARGIHLGFDHGEIALNPVPGHVEWCRLPDAANDFAQRFDEGEWPALVDAGAAL